MTEEFKREERYLVFKLADVEKDFFPSEISQLLRLYETQQSMRKQSGKPPLECVVVESDWPEYEPTWRAIEARVTGAQAQPTPSVPDAWKKDLFLIKHAMAMNNWNWNSEASNDLKREAYAAITRLLAAAQKNGGTINE